MILCHYIKVDAGVLQALAAVKTNPVKIRTHKTAGRTPALPKVE
jgi:hypothetical protein